MRSTDKDHEQAREEVLESNGELYPAPVTKLADGRERLTPAVNQTTGRKRRGRRPGRADGDSARFEARGRIISGFRKPGAGVDPPAVREGRRDNGARRWNERTRWRERERRRRREPPRCRGNLFRKIRIGKIVAQLPKSLYHARVKNSLVRFAFVSKGQNHLLIGGVEKLLQG